MQVAVDAHTSRLIVSVAIDNLGKGAAGQAIQNANLISGLGWEYGGLEPQAQTNLATRVQRRKL